MEWRVNFRNIVNFCKWVSWLEWVIINFFLLGVIILLRFYILFLSLNFYMIGGIYYERVEGKRNVIFFFWSRMMVRKE